MLGVVKNGKGRVVMGYTVEEAYKELPAFMKRDTEEGKKENYNAIRDRFKEVDALFYEEKGQTELKKAGLYLMSLIDTMSVMSQEIFEHYKCFEGLYKKALKAVLACYDEEKGMLPGKLDAPVSAENPLDMTGSFMLAYAVLKGCRMKAILSEKYLGIGKAIYETAAAMAAEEGITEMPQEMRMAYEEYQKTV